MTIGYGAGQPSRTELLSLDRKQKQKVYEYKQCLDEVTFKSCNFCRTVMVLSSLSGLSDGSVVCTGTVKEVLFIHVYKRLQFAFELTSRKAILPRQN